MHIELSEYRWLREDLRGKPWQFRYTFWIGAQRRHGFESDHLISIRGQRDPSVGDIARIRALAIAQVRRLKTLRKIAKRMPLDISVKPYRSN